MKIPRLRLATAILFWLAVSMGPSLAQRPSPQAEDPDLYFLAIGSEHYRYVIENVTSLPTPDQQALLASIEGPRNSARRVADALIQSGARDGILLLSEGPDQMVTRDDVYLAITDLKRMIREDLQADPDLNPRIVFYFMGHGIGDTASRSLYMLPGDLTFNGAASQTFTIRLIKRSIWAWDVLSALVYFRSDDSMRHFDDFYPSQLMPDITDPADAFAVLRRQNELQTIDASRRAQGAYREDGNPPVPFLVLLDNCYGDVAQDLTDIPQLSGLVGMFSLMVDMNFGELLDEALTYYATAPGNSIRPVADPADRTQNIGPLALHFVTYLASLKAVEAAPTLGDIRAAFENSPSPVNDLAAIEGWVPYSPAAGSALAPDTAIAEMIPIGGSAALAQYETRTGTGSSEVTCCR
ncbi:hypothetical protein [Rhodovulum sp. FJ3]|uniref:hypothetical protein n=1 Tax=Rhodovulum sp. FJ3 TaxID=3079053 RepID=UPI00293DB6CF|nr:hypothetical protein [Rhodovulum sp. FJ3]MDV4169676.1 hypothetical protein [Rhodovulum sp. FJ3]